MNRRALLSSIGVAALGGCSRLTDGPDRTPTGTRTPTEMPPDRTTEPAETTSEASDVDAVWTYDSGGWIDGFADGAVFCREHWIEDEGRIVAIDLESGDERWHYGYADGYEFYSDLTVEDALYFGRRDDVINGGAGEVYALDFDGTERWTFTNTSSLERRPILHDGTLYAAGDAGEVRAFDPGDGTVRWTNEDLPNSASVDSGVLTIVDVVFVDQAGLFGLDSDDGEMRWSYGEEDSRGGLQAEMGADVAYVYGRDVEGIVAVAADGSERWRESHDATEVHATADGVVIQSDSNDASLHGLDPESGSERWRHDDRRYGLLGSTDERLYAIAGDGRELDAFNVEGGSELWSDPLDGAPIADVWPFEDAEGSVFVATDGNALHRIAADGEVTWSRSLGGRVIDVVHRGDLYVGTVERLYRLPLD